MVEPLTLSAVGGRYYDNRELRGGPALISNDAEINFDWARGACRMVAQRKLLGGVDARMDFKPVCIAQRARRRWCPAVD
jgi:hypothetical protein